MKLKQIKDEHFDGKFKLMTEASNTTNQNLRNMVSAGRESLLLADGRFILISKKTIIFDVPIDSKPAREVARKWLEFNMPGFDERYNDGDIDSLEKTINEFNPLNGITPNDLKWKFSPEFYMDPKTRPEGYYRVSTSIGVKSIAYWNGDFWLCHGDEDEYADFELFIETEKVERVEL